jgi:hypothetical protein
VGRSHIRAGFGSLRGHCQLNAESLHISAIKRKPYLVFVLHDRLYFRHLYPVSFPHEEGVCERFCIKLTMPSASVRYGMAAFIGQLQGINGIQNAINKQPPENKKTRCAYAHTGSPLYHKHVCPLAQQSSALGRQSFPRLRTRQKYAAGDQRVQENVPQ